MYFFMLKTLCSVKARRTSSSTFPHFFPNSPVLPAKKKSYLSSFPPHLSQCLQAQSPLSVPFDLRCMRPDVVWACRSQMAVNLNEAKKRRRKRRTLQIMLIIGCDNRLPKGLRIFFASPLCFFLNH
jgi:hypothetical protein